MPKELQKVDELTTEPKIGTYYLVPGIIYNKPVDPADGEGEWVPIIGTPHTDKDLSAHYQHYHMDVRFRNPRSKLKFRVDYVLPTERCSEEVTYRRRRCNARMPLNNPIRHLNTQFKEFERKYLGRDVLCGRCPHRNFPIESLPNEHPLGLVVCNGHGLIIDTINKKVVEAPYL